MFLLDLNDHSRALVSVLGALELLNHERHRACSFISIAIKEAFLDKIKALAGFSLVLLANVLRSVAKAGLFEEVELGTLVEAGIAIILVRMQYLHWLFVLSDAELVEFVDQLLLLRLLVVIYLM